MKFTYQPSEVVAKLIDLLSEEEDMQYMLIQWKCYIIVFTIQYLSQAPKLNPAQTKKRNAYFASSAKSCNQGLYFYIYRGYIYFSQSL